MLDDPRRTLDPTAVQRGSSCAPGKIGHELMDERDRADAPVAVVRVEQLYPWPEAELLAVLDRYPERHEVWWVQEEPANMGAWTFVHEPAAAPCSATAPSCDHIAARRARAPRAAAPRSTTASSATSSPPRSPDSSRLDPRQSCVSTTSLYDAL